MRSNFSYFKGLKNCPSNYIFIPISMKLRQNTQVKYILIFNSERQ